MDGYNDQASTSGYHGRKQARQLRQVATYCRPETISFLDQVKDGENLKNRGEAIDALVDRILRSDEGRRAEQRA